MQAEHYQVHLGHQRALGGSVLAQLWGNAHQLNAGHALEPFPNLQAGGAGFAVNEDFVHAELPFSEPVRAL